MTTDGHESSAGANTESKQKSRTPQRSRKNANPYSSNKENIPKPQEKTSKSGNRSETPSDTQKYSTKRTTGNTRDPDLRKKGFRKDDEDEHFYDTRRKDSYNSKTKSNYSRNKNRKKYEDEWSSETNEDYDKSGSDTRHKEHHRSSSREDSTNSRSQYQRRGSRRERDSSPQYSRKSRDNKGTRRSTSRNKYYDRRSDREESPHISRSRYKQKRKEHLETRRARDSDDSRNKYSHRKDQSDEDSYNSRSERGHKYERKDSDYSQDDSYRRSRSDDYSDTSRDKSYHRRSRRDDDSYSRSKYSYKESRRNDGSGHSRSKYAPKYKEHWRSKSEYSDDTRAEHSYDDRKSDNNEESKERSRSGKKRLNTRDSYTKRKFRGEWKPKEVHNELIEIPRKPKVEIPDSLKPTSQESKVENTNREAEPQGTDHLLEKIKGKITLVRKARPKYTRRKKKLEPEPSNDQGSTNLPDQKQEADAENGFLSKVHIFPRSHWKALPPTSTQPFIKQPSNVQFTFNGSSCTNPAMCIKTLQEIQKDHMNRGLSDIAYNFMIGLDSNVYEGRGWDNKPDVLEQENIPGEEPLDDRNVIVSFLGEPMEFYRHMKAVNKGHDLVSYGYENKLLYVPPEYRSAAYAKIPEDNNQNV